MYNCYFLHLDFYSSCCTLFSRSRIVNLWVLGGFSWIFGSFIYLKFQLFVNVLIKWFSGWNFTLGLLLIFPMCGMPTCCEGQVCRNFWPFKFFLIEILELCRKLMKNMFPLNFHLKSSKWPHIGTVKLSHSLKHTFGRFHCPKMALGCLEDFLVLLNLNSYCYML